MANVVDNKVRFFVEQHGWILISVGYDLVPQVQVTDQVRQMHQAIASVQKNAHEWGGDANQMVVMGHSAGAHLVMMATAQTAAWPSYGIQPWAATVSLDAGALDVAELMNARPLPLYRKAFGKDPAYWNALSPSTQWKSSTVDTLLVCSSRRRDACPQADTLVGRYSSKQQSMLVMQMPMSHGDINKELGTNSTYSNQVLAWMNDALKQHASSR